MVSSGATPELIRLAELMRIPVVMTLMGKGGFPSSHPLNLGAVGMHGARYANHALTQSDLIIAAGARFSDRVTGDVADFAPNAKIIHIDIDPAEIGKILHADVPIVGDLPVFYAALRSISRRRAPRPATTRGSPRSSGFALVFPTIIPMWATVGRLVPERVMEGLSARLDPARTIVTTEVGQHQMWANQFIDREQPRTFLSSGGLGDDGVRVSRRHRRRRSVPGGERGAWRAMARFR